ncbi:MAG: pantoate--beta-alanine ligase [Proteiniphilum sp.]|jgi:pantoate--beta-alanine ligase|nr:pantoate--beta-alanine ligase [Proteiniphilum sp.]
MKIVHSAAALEGLLRQYREEGKSVGFVPTMGALHEGHAALVRRCAAENGVCAASIFVNPAQFDNPEDLRLYPRTPEGDCVLLEEVGADIVFVPSEEEVYPVPDNRVFDFGLSGRVMEGACRPGHFDGVARVVSRLFDLVKPHRAYFGEKDFQQLVLVRRLVEMLQLPVEIVAVATVREPDGLAMSSRNRRLTAEQRVCAAEIFHILRESLLQAEKLSPDGVIRFVTGAVNNVPELRVEYFNIVDGLTLQPVTSWRGPGNIVGAIAVYCGEVRLIDNIRYR